MKISEKNISVFKAPSDYYLVQCISADFVFNSGIRRDYSARGVKKLLRRETEGLNCKLGCCIETPKYQYVMKGMNESHKGVFNLIIKENNIDIPMYRNLDEALQDMYDIINYKIESGEKVKIAMHRLGSGSDYLDWRVVRKTIEHIFKDLDVEVLVCNSFK